LDPVRLLNESYRRFRLVPSSYYSRSFGPSNQGGDAQGERTAPSPERKKRKRKRQPKPRELNAVERIAEARHQVTMCCISLLLLAIFFFSLLLFLSSHCKFGKR
jgi:hypothetical protein